MTPKIKYGLIVGGVGLIPTIIVAALLGICGPVLALIAGAVAGLLANRQEGGGAKTGAVSGLLAGALILVGQLLGGIIALVYVQGVGIAQQMGVMPDAASQAGYWVGGLGAGICFGLIDIALAAGAGAAAVAIVGPKSPAEPPVMPPM